MHPDAPACALVAHVEPREEIRERDLGDGTVDDEAHRALGVVLTPIDHYVDEPRVPQRIGGDQQLTGEDWCGSPLPGGSARRRDRDERDEGNYDARRGSTCSRRSTIERSHAACGRHSCAITSSAPNPPTSSRSFASLAATVSGSPTIQMLSRRYGSVTSESGIAGSTLIISSPRIFPKSRKK